MPRPDRSRWILLLLVQGEGGQRYNKPVVGRTRLIKELFLAKLAYGLKEIEYEFIPYWYGPFSAELYADLVELKDNRLVSGNDSPGGEILSLTPSGVKAAQAIERVAGASVLRKLRDCKVTYNSMPFEDLVTRVYERWPEYTARALRSPSTMLEEFRRQAKRAKITEADVDRAIAEHRSRASSA